ncbi:hypothetical protein [Synoicihabitans lomoniglobus]|uniref:Uncharacterized protein n=1 Tax=Synoicihabitans lomoniglobus TaxID=2909285 RepID=A0AAF0CSM3_9BACT|nr:hypothetical protein [Opitutaceae bacterium LMO-M01]WED67300.1 hypothetical protein PXH66_10605 [Opitutaceae bacterium LMO-M01]
MDFRTSIPRCLGLLFIGVILQTGCSTVTIDAAETDQWVSPQLSLSWVKKTAKDQIVAHGFDVPNEVEWWITLQVRDTGLVWSVMTVDQGRAARYWVLINDATGDAEFLQPTLPVNPQ